ncbi:MAG: AAA family ATPase [Bacteroidia bacterium]|nr:AAA family ATPase [Bacteroidia bacterium]
MSHLQRITPMRLKRITIQNFKCFQEPQNLDLGKITLLTGANSSGKSSVLYGMLGPLQSDEFPFTFSVNGKYVNMGDFREIVFNHAADRDISLGFVFENGSINRIESVWTDDKPQHLPILKHLHAELDYFTLLMTRQADASYRLSYQYDPDRDPLAQAIASDRLINIFNRLSSSIETAVGGIMKSVQAVHGIDSQQPMDLQRMWQASFEAKTVDNQRVEDIQTLKAYVLQLDNLRIRQIIESLTAVFREFDDKINYISSFRLHPDRTYLEKTKADLKIEKFGEGYLDQIIYWETQKAPEFKRLIQVMKQLGLLHGIKSRRLDGGRFEFMVRTGSKGAFSALSDVGFGISQFLPVLVADLQLPDDSTLVVSQPEIHLHPSTQSRYGAYLVEEVNRTDKRYVIETHSEYLINRIRLEIVKGNLKPEDLQVYFTEQTPAGGQIHTIRFARNGQVHDAPDDFFKTYMMDVMEIALHAES